MKVHEHVYEEDYCLICKQSSDTPDPVGAKAATAAALLTAGAAAGALVTLGLTGRLAGAHEAAEALLGILNDLAHGR